jgi:hypothetical protein
MRSIWVQGSADEVEGAKFDIEQRTFYGASRLIGCNDIQEGPAGQSLMPGRKFGVNFIYHLVSRVLPI